MTAEIKTTARMLMTCPEGVGGEGSSGRHQHQSQQIAIKTAPLGRNGSPQNTDQLSPTPLPSQASRSDAAMASEKARAHGPFDPTPQQAKYQGPQAVIDRAPTAKRRRHNLGPKAYEEPFDASMPHQKKPGPTPEGVDPGRAPTADYASLYAGRA
jgi:hypothetical protein